MRFISCSGANLNMAAKQALSKTYMLIGWCVPCVKPNVVKVKVPRMVFDDYLHMYFKEVELYFADDPRKQSKVGDYVLIRELAERKTTLITHEVLKIVYPMGDVTDPITGKKVVRHEYRVDIEEEAVAYDGGNPNRFKYDEAPPRGWQEGKRDFSSQETIRPHWDKELTIIPPKEVE